jgi:hypothetical protein
LQSVNSESEIKEDQIERDKLILILLNEIIGQVKEFSGEKFIDFEAATSNSKTLEDPTKSIEIFENFKSKLIHSTIASQVEHNCK